MTSIVQRRAPVLRPPLRFGLAALAIILTAGYLVLVIAAADYTFAFDYRAYDAAARRLVAGEALYDLSFSQTGVFGLFYYPPTFVLAVLPFTLLDPSVGAWMWLALAVASTVGAIALLPVARDVRWLVLLLAGVSWPFLFDVKVGQVGPLLLLAFAAGWRWLDRPIVVGVLSAVGAAIKLQPILLTGWLVLTGRWRGLAAFAATATALALLATVVAGPGAWADFVTIVTRVSDALRLPQNFAPGATALFLGLDAPVASLVQWSWVAAVGVLLLWLARAGTAEASYLAFAVASQVVSPILWDHYALVLLLPVAWLVERRQWWAVLIPLSQSAPLVNVTPPILWLAGYVAALAGLAILGRRPQDAAVPDGARPVGSPA